MTASSHRVIQTTLRCRRWAAFVFAAAICLAVPLHAADAITREVHGAGDAFVAPGIALAWGVLRGTSEATTKVVLRIDVDPRQFAAVGIRGSDPFTHATTVLLAPTRTARAIAFAMPRTHFAQFPRTDLEFFVEHPGTAAIAPALTVYFVGVPDTTPEFTAADKLDEYLALRLTRMRQENPKNFP